MRFTAIFLAAVAAHCTNAATITTSLPPLPHNGDYHFADFCFDMNESIEVTKADGDVLFGTARVEWCYTSNGTENFNFDNEQISITGSIDGMDFSFSDGPDGPDDNIEHSFRGSPYAWNHLMSFESPFVIDDNELFGVTAGTVQFIKEQIRINPPASNTIPGDVIEYIINPAFDYTSDSGPIARVRGVSGPVSVSAVPEPAGLEIIALMGLVVLLRHQQKKGNRHP